jgi:hypothetical protein
MVASTEQAEFISSRAGRLLLGVNRNCFARILARGLLTTRRIPGSRPLVLRADVERLVKESTFPAMSTQSK